MEAVVEWINGVLDALEDAVARLVELAEEILELAAEVAERSADAGERLLESVAALRRESARDGLIDALADAAVDRTLDALKETDAWGLISWNSDFRREMRTAAKGALRSALDNDVVDDVLDAVGDAAAGLDDVLDELREVDPERALAPQLAAIILDRVEEAIDEALGDPIRVSLSFRVNCSPVFEGRVSLGRLEIDLDVILDAVRDVADGFGAFEDAVADGAAALAAAFTAEEQLAARRPSEARSRRSSSDWSVTPTRLLPPRGGSRSSRRRSPRSSINRPGSTFGSRVPPSRCSNRAMTYHPGCSCS